MINEFDYSIMLWDLDVDYQLYSQYVAINEAMYKLPNQGDVCTFWLLVFAAEGKELP